MRRPAVKVRAGSSGRTAGPVALVALLALLAPGPATAVESGLPAVALRIRARLDAARPGALVAGGEWVRSVSEVTRFYEGREFRPAWTDGRNFLPVAASLVRALDAARSHGLRAEDYPLGVFRDGPAGAGFPENCGSAALADTDILLTDAFLTFGGHLLGGRLDPGSAGPEGGQRSRGADLLAALDRGLAKERVEEELAALAPAQPRYRRLQAALERYRAIVAAGGWEALPSDPVLKKGSHSPAVSALRKRLGAEGYDASAETTEAMDEILEAAVRAYQARNGLAPDGVVGPDTWTALNVSAEARVAQLEANLERWRWRGSDLEPRHLRVNVADYRLEVVESGRVVLTLAVVVGRDRTPTPVFSAPMTHIVLNPSWNVPPKIASQELLPDVRRDLGYLAKRGFRVLRGWGDEGAEVDPSTVDWATVSLNRAGLRFRQDPGPANALGRLKFLFPNRFHVYLHDTPAKGLFARARRDFSHGCIRVQHPEVLAEHLLRGDPRWTPERLREILERGEEQTVLLSTPIPVHLEYFTAWAEEDGSVHFRPDIYGRDAPLYAALGNDPASG